MNASHDFLRMLVPAFQGVLTASWQGSLAIVLVLLVRQALGSRAPARWHYLLWFLVLARLLVPAFAMPRNPASLENIPALAHPFRYAPAVELSEAARDGRAAAHPPDFTPESLHSFRAVSRPTAAGRVRTPWSGWTWAALAWIVGALVLGSWFLACAAKFRRRLRRDVFPVDESIQAIWRAGCRRWLRRAPPRILAADWIASPALVGLWQPTLLVPTQAPASFSAQDWEHVFAHEIAHLRARDHWSQFLLLLALCAHWFNPLVWMGLRRLRADRELAADEWALQRLEGGRALAYGETLLKTLTARPGHFFQPGMVGISEDGAQMKQRLRRITAFRPRRVYGSLAGLIAVLALSAVLLGQSSSRPIADSPVKQAGKEEEKPAKLSLQIPPVTERDLPDEICAAARAGDSKKVADLLRTPVPDFPSSIAFGSVVALEDLLHGRELPAFTLLADEIRKRAIGRRRWNISDQDLSSLVKNGRTDFLDALLVRGLDLDRLGQRTKTADPATADWISRRIPEIARQRADMDALGKAAGDGDLPAMRRLLEAGVDVNGVGKDDNTPLIRAVLKDRLEAAQILLDHGAEVDKPRLPGWDFTPLCLVRSAPMAELLKKAGAIAQARLFGREVSILARVAVTRNSEIVAWFLQQGFDPKMIGDNNETLLFHLKDARTAELLLNAGVDPNHANEFKETAICTARSAEVAQALLDHGAKVNGLPEPLLPSMVNFGSAGAIETVLKAGADQDSETLQRAFLRADHLNKDYYPEKDKIRELLIARGAKPLPASAIVVPDIWGRAKVFTEDHALLNYALVKAYFFEAVGPQNGGSGIRIEDSISVEADGNMFIGVRADSNTVSFAVAGEGYATVFAGPFAPPLKEKIVGIRFALTKGFSATIQTVDETGGPIAGAKIQAYYPGPPQVEFTEESTDASGAANLEHIGVSPLNVRVGASGYQADEVSGIHLDPATPYRWTLKKATPLPGEVTSAATGQPIAGARIKLAGVRGPHDESYYPEIAPLLATSDAQGRFTLTTLRPDSRYFLFVEAPGNGGVLLGDIKAGRAELKIALGPELIVRGKVIHIPPSLIQKGEMTGGYNQQFKIGDRYWSTGHMIVMRPRNGEADFSIGALYANPVEIHAGDKFVELDTKDLPKSDLIIDLAQ
jgi:beta-lactamase regulating signal transducer with metallopeptidase domain